MSAALDSTVEVVKLARLLGVDPDELDYLATAQPDDLRRFRDQVTDVLFDGDRARLGGFAAGSRVIPAAVAATVAERALGPGAMRQTDRPDRPRQGRRDRQAATCALPG